MTNSKSDFKLAGIKLKGKTTNQNNQASKDCGDLWQKFEKDGVYNSIPDKLSNEIYAVYYDYDKDETAPYSYFIGCKVNPGSDVPEHLDELYIPAQDYTRFTAKGTMVGCLVDTWKEIWSTQLSRSYGFDFEIYDERSHDWSNAEVDIFISMK